MTFDPDQFIRDALGGEEEAPYSNLSDTELRQRWRAGLITEQEWQTALEGKGLSANDARLRIATNKQIGVSTAASTRGQLTTSEQNAVTALQGAGAALQGPEVYGPPAPEGSIDPYGPQTAGVGPAGRTFDQVTGTSYLSDAEREWYLGQLGQTPSRSSSGTSTSGSTAAARPTAASGYIRLEDFKDIPGVIEEIPGRQYSIPIGGGYYQRVRATTGGLFDEYNAPYKGTGTATDSTEYTAQRGGNSGSYVWHVGAQLVGRQVGGRTIAEPGWELLPNGKFRLIGQGTGTAQATPGAAVSGETSPTDGAATAGRPMIQPGQYAALIDPESPAGLAMQEKDIAGKTSLERGYDPYKGGYEPGLGTGSYTAKGYDPRNPDAKQTYRRNRPSSPGTGFGTRGYEEPLLRALQFGKPTGQSIGTGRRTRSIRKPLSASAQRNLQIGIEASRAFAAAQAARIASLSGKDLAQYRANPTEFLEGGGSLVTRRPTGVVDLQDGSLLAVISEYGNKFAKGQPERLSFPRNGQMNVKPMEHGGTVYTDDEEDDEGSYERDASYTPRPAPIIRPPDEPEDESQYGFEPWLTPPEGGWPREPGLVTPSPGWEPTSPVPQPMPLPVPVPIPGEGTSPGGYDLMADVRRIVQEAKQRSLINQRRSWAGLGASQAVDLPWEMRGQDLRFGPGQYARFPEVAPQIIDLQNRLRFLDPVEEELERQQIRELARERGDRQGPLPLTQRQQLENAIRHLEWLGAGGVGAPPGTNTPPTGDYGGGEIYNPGRSFSTRRPSGNREEDRELGAIDRSQWTREPIRGPDGKWYWPDSGGPNPQPGMTYTQALVPLTPEYLTMWLGGDESWDWDSNRENKRRPALVA